MEQPFDERHVRGSECLAYEIIEGQLIKVDFLLFTLALVLGESPKTSIFRPTNRNLAN